jgi:hypothetical protein
MGIVHRHDVRRSRRKIKVPQHLLPPPGNPWSNEESDEDPSYIPSSSHPSSDDETSLLSESDGCPGADSDESGDSSDSDESGESSESNESSESSESR